MCRRFRGCQLGFPADASQIGFAFPITKHTLGILSSLCLPPRVAVCLLSPPPFHYNPLNPLKTVWTNQCSGTADGSGLREGTLSQTSRSCANISFYCRGRNVWVPRPQKHTCKQTEAHIFLLITSEMKLITEMRYPTHGDIRGSQSNKEEGAAFRKSVPGPNRSQLGVWIQINP